MQKRSRLLGNSKANWEKISLLCLWQEFRIQKFQRNNPGFPLIHFFVIHKD
jgi:hypothetical protein